MRLPVRLLASRRAHFPRLVTSVPFTDHVLLITRNRGLTVSAGESDVAWA
jgi:hypothetical protein